MPSRRFLPGLALLATGLAGGWLARGWINPVISPTATRGPTGAPTSLEPPKPQMVADVSKATGPAKPSAALELARKIVSAKSEEDAGLGNFTADKFTTYLERHQRNATSLLAVWHLTKNKAVLREAYEKTPSDPLVALRAFQYLELSAEEKRALTARLEQEHPNNPLGSVLSGAQLATEGKNSEAVDKLREAVSRGPLDFDVKIQQLARKEALMSLGNSALEAQVVSIFTDDASQLSLYRQLAFTAAGEIKNLQAANNTDSALSMAGDLLAYGHKLAAQHGGGLISEMEATSIEAAALRALPPDVEIGDTGLTATKRMEELKKVKDAWGVGVDDFPWHLSHLDEPGLDLYLQVLDQRGEREAVKWAEAYHGPAPQRPPR